MLVVGNWKAYIESLAKAKRLYAASKRLGQTGKVDIVLAPPSPYLAALASGNRSKVEFAVQDVSATLGGAKTGEVTAETAADAGATYAIVGHSERRAMGDTDAIVLAKAQHALAHGLTPILCIGEAERDAEATYLTQLRNQIAAVFGPLSQKERTLIIVAYEPIWAIGKTAGDAMSPTDLTEMVLYIRKVLSEYLPGKGSARVPVLYGGSAEPSNARALASGTGIDGFLVGHASADVAMFGALVKSLT